MNIHKNARLTPMGRERIVRRAAGGRNRAEIAVCVGVSLKTIHKWIARLADDKQKGAVSAQHALKPVTIMATSPVTARP